MHVDVANQVRLVPPTLRVLSALITYQIDLQTPVLRLIYRARMGHSYAQLEAIKFPKVKIETCRIGHGLTCTYTETRPYRGLVWLAEVSCHPICSFLGRKCQGNMSSIEWLEKIEKKHLEWLDKLPNV